MLRLAVLISSFEDTKTKIYVDAENADDIRQYFESDERHKKKMRFIFETLLRGFKNSDIYTREDFETGTENVTAMKFFKGQENDRIYCQENEIGDKRIIILSELHKRKKSEKLSNKEKAIIRRVSKYEYKYKDQPD